MRDAFARAHSFTAYWEGGFSDHPCDRGGLTAWGISRAFLEDLAATPKGERFLRDLGVRLPVGVTSLRRLNRTQARRIFRYAFWDRLDLDSLPFRMATILYDAAVNCGCVQAVKLAQRGYNHCVLYGVRLAEDGILGSRTRSALAGTDTDRCVEQILEARRAFYRLLVARDPSQRVFLHGWLRRVNSLEAFVLRGRMPDMADRIDEDDEVDA